jgi:hypothetical protein
MPLKQSASKEAFGENVAKEKDAGKPTKQAVAIAYAIKRGLQHKHKSKHHEE